MLRPSARDHDREDEELSRDGWISRERSIQCDIGSRPSSASPYKRETNLPEVSSSVIDGIEPDFSSTSETHNLASGYQLAKAAPDS
jgi:hypothetical protein